MQSSTQDLAGRKAADARDPVLPGLMNGEIAI